MTQFRADYHKQMGRKAAELCISKGGSWEQADYYCPLICLNNAGEFQQGWNEVWAKHREE